MDSGFNVHADFIQITERKITMKHTGGNLGWPGLRSFAKSLSLCARSWVIFIPYTERLRYQNKHVVNIPKGTWRHLHGSYTPSTYYNCHAASLYISCDREQWSLSFGKKNKAAVFFSDTSGRKPILSMHTSLNFIGREDLVDPFGQNPCACWWLPLFLYSKIKKKWFWDSSDVYRRGPPVGERQVGWRYFYLVWSSWDFSFQAGSRLPYRRISQSLLSLRA